tara:strand:- start:5134 stop:6048 length:915 start_codon:yes stop_codon:yes gene_type:complete
MKYLVVKSMAGIGNRLSIIGEAIYYAIISRRGLIIDWSDHMFSDNGENAFYKYFDVRYDKLLLKHSYKSPIDIPDYKNKSVCPLCWTKYLDKPSYHCLYDNKIWKLNDYYKDKAIYPVEFNIHNITAYKQDILVYTNYVGKNRTRDMKNITKYISIKSEYLKIPRQLMQRMNNNYIAVHIRYTDKKCNYKLALNMIINILMSTKNTTLYLATDSSIILDKVNKINSIIKKQKKTNNNIMYIDKPLSRDDKNIHYNSTYNKHNKFQDIITDLEIMRHSRKLICWDKSTFTWLPQSYRHYKNIIYI